MKREETNHFLKCFPLSSPLKDNNILQVIIVRVITNRFRFSTRKKVGAKSHWEITERKFPLDDISFNSIN